VNPGQTASPFFGKIYLLGTGLIGGSLMLDLREKGCVGKVCGFDSNPQNLRRALEMGILDEASDPSALTFQDSDLIVLAIPVIALDSVLEKGFGVDALVTDVGSVKASSVRAYRKALEGGAKYSFVPAHPIAGDEKSGPEAARKGLFEGARVIITPLGEPGHPEDTVRRMWETVGGKVQFMDPGEHDSVFSWVSHMPHMAAYAIIDSILGENPDLIGFSGGGLRDYTRIAASSPAMWAQIAVANREKLLESTRGLKDSVEKIIQVLEKGSAEDLERIFTVLAGVRRGL